MSYCSPLLCNVGRRRFSTHQRQLFKYRKHVARLVLLALLLFTANLQSSFDHHSHFVFTHCEICSLRDVGAASLQSLAGSAYLLLLYLIQP